MFFDACRTHGIEFAQQEPLWLSWSLEHFGASRCLAMQHRRTPLTSQSTHCRRYCAHTCTI